MNFFHTRITPESIQRALACLRSGFLSEGRMVRQFEEALAGHLGLVGPVALNSGTSALHLGLVLAGVGPGDEVILPAQTFVASGLSVLMCGAKPVFADIQRTTGNLDPKAVSTKISPKTKVILPVHWAGYPCDMDEIQALAKENGLTVLEDAAHALGATYKGRPIGSLSRFTAFSFQAIKHLSTGDGGALCCSEGCDFEEAKRRRWFGIDRVRDAATILGEREYDLNSVGFKYHLNDLAASVGLGNLSGLPQVLARHRSIASRYREELQAVAGLEHLECRQDRESSCWVFTVLVDRREDFIRALEKRGVPASVVHLRIDRNRVLGGIQRDLVNQDWFNDRQVALPVHVGLKDDDVDQVVRAVKLGW